MDIHEIVRLKRAGQSNAEIARLLGRRRKTVRKYVTWATEQGVLEGDALSVEALHRLLEETMPIPPPPKQLSSLAKYEDEIKDMREADVEMAAICQRLQERHEEEISYEALRRLVRRLEPRKPEPFVRVEVGPGDEAQVDFGYAGLTLDETDKRRKTWAFVMTLSHSRHQYVELVYDQKVETWLACHVHAFDFFGGAPKRIVPDNLKSAIVKACRSEPLAQRSYRELALHYGFLIDPQPPGEPHLKGKVEQGGVHYFKRNFMAGREIEPTFALNQKALVWCLETAGLRKHGTTGQQPLEVFEAVEQQALRPLPRSPYDMGVWAKVTLAQDCHFNFDKARYSAPFRLVGDTLHVRGGIKSVRIYNMDHELLATHDRAEKERQAVTNPAHLPPYKLPGITLTREGIRLKATEIGPSTEAVVQALLEHRPEDRWRSAGRLLELAKRYSPERLERACARALYFGEPRYTTVAGVLKSDKDAEPLPEAAPQPAEPSGIIYQFARHASEVVTALKGVGS